MIVLFLSLILSLLTFVSISRKIWWLTIFDFFRLQYAFLAGILICFSFYSLNIWLISINIITIIFNLYRVRNFLPQFSSGNIYHNKQVFSVNAYKKNFNPDLLKSIIKKADPELLLIMEMTCDLDHALGKALDPYKHEMITFVRDGFSMNLLSKHPLTNQKITYHGHGKTPLLSAQVILNNTTYTVFSAHPKPAINKEYYKERGIYFHEIEEIIMKTAGPIIVLGDFNSVPWERHFKKFLKNTNLKSTVEGQGYQVTWPVYFPILGVPMDHILISRNQDYTDLNIGPYVGSDHYPVSINLKKN